MSATVGNTEVPPNNKQTVLHDVPMTQVRTEPFAYPPGLSQPPPPYGNGPPGMPLPYLTGQPIQQQPMSQINAQGTVSEVHWMPAPAPLPNCPPGLEYLASIDQLLVHQKIELLEIVTGFETQNKYKIRNSLGQDVFFAAEDSDCCARNCCGPIRPFEMKIFDNFKHEVIHLYRPLGCQECCYPCCLQTMEVSSPPGNLIGSIQQEWSIFYPTFAVKDASGDTVLRIEGPCITCRCCSDVNFRVTNADGSADVGKITKQWSGLVREAFTDADNFGITFPLDLDVKMKAVLLGGLFLIDYMFFEKSGNNN